MKKREGWSQSEAFKALQLPEIKLSSAERARVSTPKLAAITSESRSYQMF